MSEYLTPGEFKVVADRHVTIWPDYCATLREYAAIVEAVATMNERQAWASGLCNCQPESEEGEAEVGHYWIIGAAIHAPDCTYLRAREVRGYE